MAIRSLLHGLVVLYLLTTPTLSRAAPGDLDSALGGFGIDGRIGALGFDANAMVIDDQGRLVIVGTSANTFFVQRRSGPRFLTTESVGFLIDGSQESAVARAVALTDGGKIVVAGSVDLPDRDPDFAVARLNPDLTLDASFAGDGTQNSDFDGREDQAYGVAVQWICTSDRPPVCDQKITVVGEAVIEGVFFTDPDFAVERFNGNGTLDATFSGNGKGTYDISEFDGATAIAIQGDGKPVVVGRTTDGFTGDFAMVRLNLNGSLDGSFDGDGVVVTDFGGNEFAAGVALAPDGKIVVAGRDLIGTGGIKLARYLPGGVLDGSFNFDGRIATPFDGHGYAMIVQPDSRVVVAAGTYLPAPDGDFALLRYDPDGSHDETFDADGIVFTSFGAVARPRTLALQPDGMLVAAGGGHAARYRWDGSLDTGGMASLGFNPSHTGSEATAMAVGADGKLVAAGKANVQTYRIALARFEADYGNGLDLSFGTDSPRRGKTLYGLFDGVHDEVHAMALQPDGKTVVAGKSLASDFDILLARFNADGTPDTNCSGGGLTREDFGIGDDSASAVVRDPANRLYVAGTARGPINSDFALLRYTPGCVLDSAHGSDFLPLYRFRFDLGGDDILGGMLLQGARPVLAGVSGSQIVLVRILVDFFGHASLDPTFGVGGRASLDLGTNEVVTGLAQQEDGKLIVSGTVDRAGPDFAVARFTTDGQLDTAFGSGGSAFADFGGLDAAYALAVRADGTIAVAGRTIVDSREQFALALFTRDGITDTAFNGTGKATLSLAAMGQDLAQAVTFVGPDRLVVGGYSTVFGIRQFSLAAFETTLACLVGTLSDRDCDGISNASDVCPDYQQAASTDVDVNGIGNECECGDQNGDGRVNVSDLVAISLAIFNPGLATPLCDANNDGACNVSDIVGANTKIFGGPAYCSRYPPPGA